MNMTKGPARLGFAAALLALLIAPLAFGVHSAHAQGPTQNIYYGTGLEDGVIIAASIDDVLCSETTSSASDGWVIYVDEGACGGGAVDGATIVFKLNGAKAAETATWSPTNVEQLSLTVAPIMDDGDDGMTDGDDGMDDGDDGMDDGDDGMDDGDDGMTDGDDGMTDDDDGDDGPGMVDTGNAGLVSSDSGSPLLALVLGFLAVAGLAGARVSTRRVS